MFNITGKWDEARGNNHFPHAYKHGLTESQIRYAWNHAVYRFDRIDDDERRGVVAIGPIDETSEMIGLVAHCAGVIGERKGDNVVVIFHTSCPPIASLIRELEEWKGERS